VAIFKERAVRAYERARDALDKGDCDWAVFLLEQALQLLVKYFLALRIGYFPRTRSLSRLLEEAGELDPGFVEFLREHRDSVAFLEDAYVSSRYLLRRYSRDEVERRLHLFGELLKLVERHEGD